MNYTLKDDAVYTSHGWLTIYWVLSFTENNYLSDKKPFLNRDDAEEYKRNLESKEKTKE